MYYLLCFIIPIQLFPFVLSLFNQHPHLLLSPSLLLFQQVLSTFAFLTSIFSFSASFPRQLTPCTSRPTISALQVIPAELFVSSWLYSSRLFPPCSSSILASSKDSPPPPIIGKCLAEYNAVFHFNSLGDLYLYLQKENVSCNKCKIPEDLRKLMYRISKHEHIYSMKF